MSGGSLEYIYGSLNTQIDQIVDFANETYCPCHGDKANAVKWETYCRFITKLREVSDALHDIEWVMSGDYGHGAEFSAIAKVLNEEEKVC